MPYKDPEKRKAYEREYTRRTRSERTREIERAYYQRNKDKMKAKSQRLETKARKYVRETKEGKPCADCGGFFPSECLDYDHLPEFEKSFTLAKPGSRGKKLIDSEIKKCELVCANCHRIRTRVRVHMSADI